MKLERRAYESRAVASIREALTEHRRVVAVGPTGCGKTVIASMLIRQERTWRVLFLAHTFEIVDQAHARLADHGITAGVLMATDERLHGDARVDASARVQVGSVQTVVRRGGPECVDLIVFDEAHRTMANSYQQIAAKYPNAMVLGLTATPIRMDGKGLGDFYEHMVIIAKPSELQAAGYLAKPRVFAASEKDLAELRSRTKGEIKSGGDYSGEALARIVAGKVLLGNVVNETIRLAPKVPKVAFAGSVEHSKALTKRFRQRGVHAEHLDGETHPTERRMILDGLRSGTIEVVCNVDVLSEGWDLPALGAVVLARPTRSEARLLQMTGRCQRPWKGERPLILDHGNSVIDLRCALPGTDREWSLYDSKPHRDGLPIFKRCDDCGEAIAAGCTECPECGAEQPRTEKQEREEREVKLVELEASRLRARFEKVAMEKGAPDGWVDRRLAEMTT